MRRRLTVAVLVGAAWLWVLFAVTGEPSAVLPFASGWGLGCFFVWWCRRRWPW